MLKSPSFSQSTEVPNSTLKNIIKKVEKCDSLYSDYQNLTKELDVVFYENLELIEINENLETNKKIMKSQLEDLKKIKQPPKKLKNMLIGFALGMITFGIIN